MQVKDQPAGNDELRYFGSLYMLGSQIPWDQLTGGKTPSRSDGLTGIGGGRSVKSDDEGDEDFAERGAPGIRRHS